MFRQTVSTLSQVEVSRELGPLLSHSAVIVDGNTTAYPRWSSYEAPAPGVVVTPATEEDVAKTVEFATSKNIPFLAQTGAHGWSEFHLKQNGIIINMRKLNSVSFNCDKTQVTIGGGVLISELTIAAFQNMALVHTGNCPCVGVLGAGLGGGYGNLQGLYGLAVDNMLSLNVVLADGKIHTITPKDEDLWWALRGAGPNFGIVTSAILKSFPVSSDKQIAWFGQLIYSGDKIEDVVKAIDNLTLAPEMSIFMYFITSGAPNYSPMIALTPFYYGREKEARAAFKPLLDLGPTDDTTSELQYAHWNDGAEGFCTKGGYKPAYTAGLTKMDSTTWKAAWDEYVKFVAIKGAGQSIVIMEAYSLEKSRSFLQSSSAFAWRNKVNFNAVAIPWYYDSGLESEAKAFGSKLRDLWRSTDGLDSPAAYINFAHGDEDLSAIYGENLDRLRSIKVQVDPNNVFNQWFTL
ncbi:FAD-binding oxidoreductase [Aspergillus tanneri]|nr:uncharacterized protein ATNIH1004_011386 [Aspergillus tanneri]KAA8642442.1 hypothetical protein ATNIH1004_011386 [Aspergillus tanneri]